MDLVQKFEKNLIKQNFPDIRAGDTVRVHQKIKEAVVSEAKTKKKQEEKEKERIQIFEGIVLYVRGGKGMPGTFCVRKVSSGIGVEKIFPIHMPSIVKIEVIKRGKVRRAKLFYLRRKEQKEAKIREEKMTEELRKSLVFESEELKQKTEEKIKQKEEEKKQAQAKKEEEKKTKAAQVAQNPAKAKKEETKPETKKETKKI